jgi:hypothetical protein
LSHADTAATNPTTTSTVSARRRPGGDNAAGRPRSGSTLLLETSVGIDDKGWLPIVD